MGSWQIKYMSEKKGSILTDITYDKGTVTLSCGQRGWWDEDGYCYRCFTCLMVAGSVGSPCYQKENKNEKISNT